MENEVLQEAGPAFRAKAVNSRIQQFVPCARNPCQTPTERSSDANFEHRFGALRRKFRRLQQEEDRLLREEPARERCYAYVAGDEPEPAVRTAWVQGDLSEALRAHFDLIAAEAGMALDPPAGILPAAHWLCHVYQDLRAQQSDYIRMETERGAFVERLIEASALCCIRLQRYGVEQSALSSPRQEGEVQLRTSGGSDSVCSQHYGERHPSLIMFNQILREEVITIEAWASQHKLSRTVVFDWRSCLRSGRPIKGRISASKCAEIEEAIQKNARELGITRTNSDSSEPHAG